MFAFKRYLLNPVMFRYISTQAWKEILVKVLIKETDPKIRINQLKELVEKNPTDLTLLGRCTGLLYQSQAYMDLPDCIKRIKSIDPESPIFLYFQTMVNLDMGFPQEALKSYNMSLDIKRELKPVEIYCKALMLRKLQRPLESLKALDTFLETEEGKDDLEALLLKIQLELEVKQFKEAFDLTNQLLKNDPKNCDFRFYKAIALRGLNQTQIAITEFTILLNDVSDPVKKGLILLERAKTRGITEVQAKIEDLKASRKLYSGIDVDRETIITYYMGNMFEEVEPLLKELEGKYNINNDYQMLLVKAAILRYQKQDYINALEIYKKVKTLAPPGFQDHFAKQIDKLNELIKAKSSN